MLPQTAHYLKVDLQHFAEIILSSLAGTRPICRT